MLASPCCRRSRCSSGCCGCRRARAGWSRKDRDDEALEVLSQVRSPERAEAEMAEVRALADEERASQTGGAADLGVPLDPPADGHRRRSGCLPAVHRDQLDHVLRQPAAGGRRLLRLAAIIANIAERAVQRPGHHGGHAGHEPDRPAHDAARRLRAHDRVPRARRASARCCCPTATARPTSSSCSSCCSSSPCRAPSARWCG